MPGQVVYRIQTVSCSRHAKLPVWDRACVLGNISLMPAYFCLSSKHIPAWYYVDGLWLDIHLAFSPRGQPLAIAYSYIRARRVSKAGGCDFSFCQFNHISAPPQGVRDKRTLVDLYQESNTSELCNASWISGYTAATRKDASFSWFAIEKLVFIDRRSIMSNELHPLITSIRN